MNWKEIEKLLDKIYEGYKTPIFVYHLDLSYNFKINFCSLDIHSILLSLMM